MHICIFVYFQRRKDHFWQGNSVKLKKIFLILTRCLLKWRFAVLRDDCLRFVSLFCILFKSTKYPIKFTSEFLFTVYGVESKNVLSASLFKST